MVCNGKLVLASRSPRRRELLSYLGLEFRVVPPFVEEAALPGEGPGQLVERLALSKASDVAQSLPGGLVLGADSIVVLDGEIMGKPADVADARAMLRRLRGREHMVFSGLAVVDAPSRQAGLGSLVTTVSMRTYSNAELEAYVASGEPMDKAGAYAVQDPIFQPAAHIEGCYPNVMGLPLCLLVDLLTEAGLEFGNKACTRVPEECRSCPLKGVG